MGQSSKVLAFICGLCGLTRGQQRQVESVARSLGDKHPARAEDVVQEMALRVWVLSLFGRRATTGDLIAAGNKAVAERS